jgi:hypothetical protein
MKKYLIFLLVFVFIVTFTAAPKTVNAVPYPNGFTPAPEVWEWYTEGVTGEEIPMYTITTTPRDWYQLKTTGLKVDGATKICHGFDAGRYGWTGEIFRLVEGNWVKLTTTVGWVPTEEGHYMACAMAPAAGTYALFGYFVKANAPVKEGLPECENWGGSLSSSWSPPTFYNFYPEIYEPKSAFVPVTYSIIKANYPMSGDVTATVLTDINGIADFSAYQWQVLDPSWEYPLIFTIHLVTPGSYTHLTLPTNREV